MTELEEGGKAFSTFRVLNGDADLNERDQLFRNMAQLYSHVSDRCDDEQVAQYDDVLCQLADLVEASAKAHVAGILAPLDRAPGSVVVKLASDEIIVAGPLLEFSNVLSDDDLIEIATHNTEEHRVRIAGRNGVNERVGDAIVEHGQNESVTVLVRNSSAIIGGNAAVALADRANRDPEFAETLKTRKDIDWTNVASKVSNVTQDLIGALSTQSESGEVIPLGKVNAVVYNRLRNRAGFNTDEWKLAWNQVKALSDRKQLNQTALTRFARFGYGHHVACCLTILMSVPQDVFVKWLAEHDYVAMTVTARAINLPPDLFEACVAAMPWRNVPTLDEILNARQRFESIGQDEAKNIFELWRAHAFRRKKSPEQTKGAA